MRRLPAIGAALVVLVAVHGAACGGGGGGKDGEACPPGSTLTIFPGQLRVTAGGAGASFGAGLTDCSADMSWALSGPGTVHPTTGVPVTYTPPAAVAAQATATLTVSAGGLSDAALITIDPASLQLAGRVIGSTGAPVPGATVRVGTGTATTDALGAFTLPGAAPPYELIATGPGGLVSSLYPDLRRSDPTIVLFDEPRPFPRTGRAQGMLTGGGGFPAPAGHVAGVAFGAAQATAWGPVEPGTGTFDLGVPWSADAGVTGVLHALQWQADAQGLPVAYDGHGRRPGVTLLGGSTATGLDLALSPVGASAVSGTIEEAGAPASSSLSLFVTFDGGARLRLLPPPADPSFFPQVGFQGAFSLPTPAVAGATVDVVARKDYAGGGFQESHRRGLGTGASGVAVVFRGVPVQNHPPSRAVVGVGSGVAFDWYTMGGNPVYVASFRGPPGSQGYDVFTTQQGFAVPAGLTVQVPATYRWKVRASTAFATVDEAAGPGGFLGGADAFERAESGEWTFTTAP